MNKNTTPEKKGRKVDLKRRAEIGKDRRARTRNLILAAAFDVFGRPNGFFTSIDIICTTAGISRATFYNHFSSVEEIYSALTEELAHDYLVKVVEANSQMPDVAERMSMALRLYLERCRLDHKWGWGMVNICAGGPLFGAETYAQVKKDLEDGMASKRFNLVSADIGRDIVMGTVLSAMITQLRTVQHSSYPSRVVKRIMIAIGVEEDAADELVKRDLPKIEYQD